MSKTKVNKSKRWAEYASKLKQWETRLIELRNMGDGYNEIRDELQQEFPRQKNRFRNNEQLRVLLYQKGRLNEAYIIYSEMVAEESLEQGQLILKNLNKRAVMTIGNLLSKTAPDPTRLGAAKEVLDRNLGKPKENIDITDKAELELLKTKLKKLYGSD